MALARAFRFSFLSGDVHLAGIGRFLSYPRSNLRTDHRFMPQIISSAMGNEPPPSEVVKAISLSAKTTRLDQVGVLCVCCLCEAFIRRVYDPGQCDF